MSLYQNIQLAETIMTAIAACTSAYCMYVVLGWQVPVALFLGGIVLGIAKSKAQHSMILQWLEEDEIRRNEFFREHRD